MYGQKSFCFLYTLLFSGAEFVMAKLLFSITANPHTIYLYPFVLYGPSLIDLMVLKARFLGGKLNQLIHFYAKIKLQDFTIVDLAASFYCIKSNNVCCSEKIS